MSRTYNKIAILYGTETGTALEVSERIALEISMLSTKSNNNLNNKNKTVTLLPIDGTDFTKWATSFDLIVFIVATAGNGDPPLSMRRTWKQLLQRNRTNGQTLTGVHFCVFGLGDSTYPRFNYMAKMFHNRLEKGLGAHPVIYRALGDDEDEQGYESELRPFLGELYYEVLGLIDKESANSKELEKLLEERERKMDEAEENDQEYEDDEELEEKIHEGYGKYVDVCKNELGVHDSDNNNNNKLIPPVLWNVEIASSSSSSHITQKRRERQDDDDNENDDNDDAQDQTPTFAINIEDYLQSKLNLSKFDVTRNERITAADHFQDVRSIHLMHRANENNNNKSKVVSTPYLPGDTFAMYPRNPPQAVSAMLQLLQLAPNDTVTISNNNTPNKSSPNACHIIETIPNQPFFDVPFRAEDLFTWVFDLHSSTSRQILWFLSFWVDKSFKESANFDGDEIYDRLMQLARYSMDDFMEYSTRERRPVWEMLQDFLPTILTENMRPSNWKSIIISSLRHIAPRHFSICKFQQQEEKTKSEGRLVDDDDDNDENNKKEISDVELLIAIHKVTTPMKRQRMGLCSSFISEFLNSSSSSFCFGFVETGVHSLPFPPLRNRENNLVTRKMILIGPGTGIAPMRAVIQRIIHDQQQQQHENNSTNDENEVLVFTGHRHPEKDFPFSHEWKQIEEDEKQQEINFYHAFSRYKPTIISSSSSNTHEDGANPTENISTNSNKIYPKYVQHAILQNKETKKKIANILNDEDSIVLVSGNAKQMPKDVLNAFCQCLVDGGMEKNMESAEKKLEKMRLNGRYVVDAWA